MSALINSSHVMKFIYFFLLKILEAVASIGARRRFIEALAPLFGRPVEADPVCFWTFFLH